MTKPTYEQLEEENLQLKEKMEELVNEYAVVTHFKHKNEQLEEENLRLKKRLEETGGLDFRTTQEHKDAVARSEVILGLVSLREENLAMREACIRGQEVEWKDYHLVRDKPFTKVLSSIPHTELLAKQREADLRVIEAAKECLHIAPHDEVWIPQTKARDLQKAIEDRERVYGQSK